MDTSPVFLSFKHVGCIILMVSCLLVPLQAQPKRNPSIRQGISLSSNIVYDQAPTSVTLVTTSVDAVNLSLGLRVLNDLKDLSAQAQYVLPSQIPWAQGVVSTTAHIGWGLVNSTLFDVVLAYAQHLKAGSLVSASLSLGLQAHGSVIPSLDDPLLTLLPYVQLHLHITPMEKLVLDTSLSTTSFFDFSGQCWTPVVGLEAAYRITDSFTVGANAFLRFSDIHPETVLILSQEVGVYVVLQS